MWSKLLFPSPFLSYPLLLLLFLSPLSSPPPLSSPFSSSPLLNSSSSSPLRDMVLTVLDRLIRGFASSAREELDAITYKLLASETKYKKNGE